MAQDTWYSLAVPLLEYLNNRDRAGPPDVGEIADALDADPTSVAREINRLADDGYIRGGVEDALGGPGEGLILRPELTGRGAQVVGAWPTADPYEALLEVINRRIAGESDEEQRSKLQKLGSALSAVGKGVAIGLLVELGKGTIKL